MIPSKFIWYCSNPLGSAPWMNQSGVPMPGPSGMNYGIGNGVSMQTGMASVTGNNGMFRCDLLCTGFCFDFWTPTQMDFVAKFLTNSHFHEPAIHSKLR